MPAKGKKDESFEEGLKRLETLAEQMEKSDMPLEALLKLYEDGMILSDALMKKLETAKGRMLEVKRGKDGNVQVAENGISWEQISLLDESDE